MARLEAVNVNMAAEFRKRPQATARLVADYGLEGDRHAGRPLRQVSLLDAEIVDELLARGMPVAPGVLGENLTIRGLDVNALPVGARVLVGQAELEITGDRPTCKEMLDVHPDALKALVGRAGKMARVVRGAEVTAGVSVARVSTPIHD